MAKFIKLTGVFGPDDPHPVGAVLVNVDQITGFTRPNLGAGFGGEEKTTLVMLSGGGSASEAKASSDLFVRETPEQILALIAEGDKP